MPNVGGVDVAVLPQGDAFGVVDGVLGERLIQAGGVLPHQPVPGLVVGACWK